jgi:hypothetical protein
MVFPLMGKNCVISDAVDRVSTIHSLKVVSMDSLTPLQSILYGMIQTFCERQAIVLEAMRELRPDQVMQAFGTGTPEERKELRLKSLRSVPVGLWGQNPEWEYFFHGRGCRLINTETNEKLQWDLKDGNLKRFDRSWFVDYLEWRITFDQKHADHVLIHGWLIQQQEDWTPAKPLQGPLEELIFSVLNDFCDMGLLAHDERHYILVDSTL